MDAGVDADAVGTDVLGGDRIAGEVGIDTFVVAAATSAAGRTWAVIVIAWRLMGVDWQYGRTW